MTDAKHEAPAEGAGEMEGLKRRIKCLEKLAGEQSLRVMQQATRAKDAENELVALRARSSAPEAREGYPSGAWGCVARLSDNTPWEAFAATEDQPDPAGAWSEIIPLYTHPDAPSADKLREAVEAIWEIAGGRAAEGHNEAGRLERIKDRAAEILAVLKAEGA